MNAIPFTEHELSDLLRYQVFNLPVFEAVFLYKEALLYMNVTMFLDQSLLHLNHNTSGRELRVRRILAIYLNIWRFREAGATRAFYAWNSRPRPIL